MGNGLPNFPGGKKPGAKKKKKKAPPKRPPGHIGKKKKKGLSASSKIPDVVPLSRCKLRKLRFDRINDWLLLEKEFVTNQEAIKPKTERNKEERDEIDTLSGTPLVVGTLEEMIDEDHCIVSTAMGPQYYVNILSFVDKDLLEPSCTVLLNHKMYAVVGILSEETGAMVNVMKVDKAPLESYADIGGLEVQIQEIKESVELPMTHPEIYEDIGLSSMHIYSTYRLV